MTNATIHVTDAGFDPPVVTVRVGETVEWVFDAANHSTTSDPCMFPPGVPDVSWDSGVQFAGARFHYTATFPGTFPYYCKQHMHMGGKVTVIPRLP